MKKIAILRTFIVVLIAAHLCLIFYLSNQKAAQSDNTSSSFIETVIKIVDKNFSELSEEEKYQKIQSYQKSVRTLAHMGEYALLGVLVCAFVLTFKKGFLKFLFGFLFCALYAASDEVHQLFVEGRSFQYSDIAVDAFGAALGMAAFFAFVMIIFSIKKKKYIRRKTENG